MKKAFVVFVFAVLFFNASGRCADVTFFACSDTHYKETKEQNANQTAGVELINSLPGTDYPASLGGGKVDTPRGVVVLGDLIDNGAVAAVNQQQWKLWTADFGVNGEGNVKFPVYEGFGNHDLHSSRFVQKDIIERNKQRKNLTAMSKNGLHYSWDWDGVHFVQLNLYPGNAWQSGSRYGAIHDPEYALDFLIEDLKTNVADSGRPIILMHHYDPRDNWWMDSEKIAYYVAIKNYNIVCIIHGHTGTGIYKWNSLDVINEGNLPGGGVFVFHITPSNELLVGQYSPKKEWRNIFRKKISVIPEGLAYSPNPGDGYELVDVNLTQLSWNAGKDISSQSVYFGTSIKEVDESTKPEKAGLSADAISCKIPEKFLPLKSGAEYFWRIEGIPAASNKQPDKGKVWSFRTKDKPEKNNITFLIVSDTHYQMDTMAANTSNIVAMNTISGTSYPEEIGGFVRTPSGLIHCGDCTSDSKQWQWEAFSEDFGVNGEGLLNYPVYEIYGNHDGGLGSVVGDGIVERNKSRRNLTNVSANGLHFSWDWDGVHFVSLGVRPGTELRPYNPHGSLDFLKEDLAKYVGNSGRAVVVFQHFGFDAAHSLGWWTEQERDAYYQVIRDYNILGIIHGHSHACEIYTWNGIDIYNAPHMQWKPEYLGFFVANITPDEMAVVERKSNATWGLRSKKKIYLSYSQGNPAAVMHNSGGASNITAVDARLNGKLVYQDPNCKDSEIYIYWGKKDGAQDKEAWENVAKLGNREAGEFYYDISSLSADSVYYYRCLAVNSKGQDWADYSAKFRTSPAVVLNNSSATEITMTGASLSGQLKAAAIEPVSVTIYWGIKDGKDDTSAWDNSLPLGNRTVGSFAADLKQLAADTTYYFRSFASNKYGSGWAKTSESFRTQPAVRIDNGEGAAEISLTSAVVSGSILLDNSPPTDVYVYWGDNDGGTSKEDWDNEISLGAREAGSFKTKIENLQPETTYFYRCFASNSAGSHWAEKSEFFTTAKDFSSWKNKMKITFKGYEKNDTLRNFPALIVLNEQMDGFKYSQFESASGGDLRFSDENGSELRFEIEKWDKTSDSLVWVQVPRIKDASSHIFAYWGNASQKELPAYALNGQAWSDGFAAVWHMGEPDVRDSLKKNNGVSKGNTSVPGIIGIAQSFERPKSYVQIDRVSPSLDIKGEITICAWVKPLGAKDILGIVTKGESWGEYNLHLKGVSAKPAFELKPFLPDARSAPLGNTTLKAGEWYHICGTWDGSIAKLFVNGQLDAQSKGKGNISSSSHIFTIGTISERFTPSIIDEVQISNTARSDDWVWAAWLNTSRNKDFCDYSVIKQ